jgi:hypothetical protein
MRCATSLPALRLAAVAYTLASALAPARVTLPRGVITFLRAPLQREPSCCPGACVDTLSYAYGNNTNPVYYYPVDSIDSYSSKPDYS